MGEMEVDMVEVVMVEVGMEAGMVVVALAVDMVGVTEVDLDIINTLYRILLLLFVYFYGKCSIYFICPYPELKSIALELSSSSN